MLWKAMLRETMIFAIKVIITGNVDEKNYIFKKNMDKVKRKNQTYFFHISSYYLERQVYLSGMVLYFQNFDLYYATNDFF